MALLVETNCQMECVDSSKRKVSDLSKYELKYLWKYAWLCSSSKDGKF